MASIEGSDIHKVVLACEAGMGSSVLVVSQLRQRLKGTGVDVQHSAVSRVPPDADLIICRAGASTVTEIAAVGAAALFVPFPAAVDDHQTANAKFLVDQGGGWLVQQNDLTPAKLAELLQKTERLALVQIGLQAKTMQKTDATARVVAACEELAI